jgi:hypothetical protein
MDEAFIQNLSIEPVGPPHVSSGDGGLRSVDELFRDISKLRYSDHASELNGIREVSLHTPLRKPGKTEFVRVHSDPAMMLTTTVFIDPDERETYLIAPSMRDVLFDLARVAILYLGITRQGVVFIWPLPLPADTGRPTAWFETARSAVELAKTRWIRMSSDLALGAYRVYQAEGQLSDPVWPDKTLGEFLSVAFKDRIIDKEDHPVVRRLRGLV